MDIEELIKILKQKTNFILTTHESPDGDGLGSEAALCLALEAMGKNCFIVNSDPTELRYDYFMHDIKVFNPVNWLRDHNPENFILLILDTFPDNTGEEMKPLLRSVDKVIPIDHHDSSEPKNKHPGYYICTSSSTCEMVYDILLSLEVEISLPMAKALFAGIVYDTGSFKYKKTGARTFQIASELVKLGVEPFTNYTSIYESNTKASLILFSRVLSTLDFYYNDRVSLITMPREMLEETGASYEEAQILINSPLGCKTVELSIFFKEDEKGMKRCSLRSKGNFNCLLMAEKFGGGGHETASGFKIPESFESMRIKVLDEIQSFFT